MKYRGAVKWSWARTAGLLSCLTLALITLNCGGSYRGEQTPVSNVPPPEGAPVFAVSVSISDESGNPVEGATITTDGLGLTTNASGIAQFTRLEGPLMAVVRADGYLAEPLPLGWSDAGQTVRVTLLGDGGGSRWVMHSTGDAMFGRRYQMPLNGDPLIPAHNIGAGAMEVVAPIRAAFAAADFRTINLETTVSDLDASHAYPGKRFILNSPTATLQAIASLETDLVVLANNHTRDYGDLGVEETVLALQQAGIPYQGADVSQEAATAPIIQAIKGLQIGTLAYTTVTGSFVNDNYPSATREIPVNLPAEERWQYEERSFSFSSPSWSLPNGDRRIGEIWKLFQAAEPDMTPQDLAAAWASIDATYPEMQDWVARRGHGGAALWNTSDARTAIAALKEQSDVVVVQLHSGFQYQETPSNSLRRNARISIDSGADLVVCHHPHVLQGVEWYKGKLIAYSLGNFVFDQDFLVTFSSAFLRTVWDGTSLIKAQLVPFEIQAYRPTPVTDVGARRTLLRVWELSLNDTQSLRDTDNAVRPVTWTPDANTQQAHISNKNHVGVITSNAPTARTHTITVRPGETLSLPDDGLYHATLGLALGTNPNILVGRDTFGWGEFEDETADSVAAGDTHWNVDNINRAVLLGDAHGGQRFLRVRGYSSDAEGILVRPLARVALPEHRIYSPTSPLATPLDPPASYTFRFHARLTGNASAWARFDIYEFVDTDPTQEPASTLLLTHEAAVSLLPDTGWNLFQVELSADLLRFEDVRANALNFYAVLAPPQSAQADLDIDDLAFIEWRQADLMPDRFGNYTWVRNTGSETITLSIPLLPLDL